MPQDRNGWLASDNLPTRPLVVAGESFTPGVLDHDDAFTVLQYVAQQMHERVEPIVRDDWHQADDWGYSFRSNANDPNSLSRHAFGLAIDYNATRHPNGTPASANFSASQITEIRKIVDECLGAVQWGGDFRSTSDPMHFQIDATKALVAQAANHIRSMKEDDMQAADWERLENIVKANAVTGAKVREIVREEINAQFDEQTTVKTGSGTRLITWAQMWREIWQKLNKHTG